MSRWRFAWAWLLLAAWAGPRACAGTPVSAALLEFLGTVGGGPPGWSAYLARTSLSHLPTAADGKTASPVKPASGDARSSARAPGGGPAGASAPARSAPGSTAPAPETAEHS